MPKDITTETQKVAGLRDDHRFMVVDPVTKELVYAEPEQLNEAGLGGSDPVFSNSSDFEI